MAATVRVAILLVALITGGCRVDGLALRQDSKVTILSPHEGQRIALPFEVKWDAAEVGSALGGKRQQFGVFVDTEPPGPGKRPHDLIREDAGCLRAAGCPSREYLANRGIHWTTDTRFIIEPASVSLQNHRHQVVIVLLDDRLRRVGETAYWASFRVKR